MKRALKAVQCPFWSVYMWINYLFLEILFLLPSFTAFRFSMHFLCTHLFSLSWKPANNPEFNSLRNMKQLHLSKLPESFWLKIRLKMRLKHAVSQILRPLSVRRTHIYSAEKGNLPVHPRRLRRAWSSINIFPLKLW